MWAFQLQYRTPIQGDSDPAMYDIIITLNLKCALWSVQVFINQGTGVGKEEKQDVDFAHKKASQSHFDDSKDDELCERKCDAI